MAVVLFCSTADMALICLGVLGLGQVMAPFFDVYSRWLLALAALWLAGYGLLRFRDGLRMNTNPDLYGTNLYRPAQGKLKQTLSILVVLTFANPHVYLDTVILLGSLSVPYAGSDKLAFIFGASAASLSFFAVLGFGARQFSHYMKSPRAWQIIDFATAFVMLLFAGLLVSQI